jgi:hypothetical protein
VTRSYRIYAALHEDIAEGFVWLKDADLPARRIVRIVRKGSGPRKSVFCEALQLEKNFLTRYNNEAERRCKIEGGDEPSALVINHWYRTKLGKPGLPLETKNDYQLEITSANSLRGRICACMQHPQVVVRVATWLGVIGVALGLLGLGFGAFGICAAVKQTTATSSAPLASQDTQKPAISGNEFQSIRTIADIAKLSFVNKRCRLWGPDGDIDVDQTCLIVKTTAGGLIAIPNSYADQEREEVLSQLNGGARDRDKWLVRFYEIGGGEKSRK